jgi:hypothetical protein
VTLVPGSPPVLAIARFDVARGTSSARASVALAPGGAATPDAEAAFDRVLAPASTTPAAGAAHAAPVAWWRSPWLWAGVGAAVATAIVLPFALSSEDSSSGGQVVVRPTGWTW